jgi:hypothetical protein
MVVALSSSGKVTVAHGWPMDTVVVHLGEGDVGMEPFGIAPFGDDLAIANHTRKTIALFRSGQKIEVDVEPHAHSVTAADFDGDGQPDLAVNDMAGRRALILWGPDFSKTTAAPSGSKGFAYLNVAAADFDGDGKPDLAIADWPQSEVSVLLNAGHRTFSAPTLLPLSNPAFYVVAGDLDGDGKADLAVAMFGGAIADSSRDGLAFLKGDGHGGFAKPQLLESGPGPTMLALANGVLAVCDQGGQQVLVYSNRLQNKEVVRTQGKPTGIALGDLDGDGKPDLAVATGDAVEIFLTRASSGDGGLHPP